MFRKFVAMLGDQNGTTLIEYALMIAFLALAIYASLANLGTASDFTFTTIANKFRAANDLI